MPNRGKVEMSRMEFDAIRRIAMTSVEVSWDKPLREIIAQAYIAGMAHAMSAMDAAPDAAPDADTKEDRCRFECPHGDRCTLSAGHDGGHNHRACDCNEPDTAPDADTKEG